MQSPNSAHDEHLRRLLDQRTARADLHNRFPSYAESYDSPSIYSHPVFSPRPNRSAEQPQSSRYASSTIEPRSPMSDRERLNDPSASILDLEDDPRYSYASQDYSDDDHSSQHTIDDNDDDPRLSVLGPKMRFHSPAPWEMGGDSLPEEDESEPSRLSRIISDSKSEKSRGGIMKGLGLSRGSSNGRPSNESSRSSGRTKQSFETNSSYISPGGALHALAQSSMSSTSLNLPPSSPATTAAKNKFPTMRVRTQASTSSTTKPFQLRPPPESPRLVSNSSGSPPSSAGSDNYGSSSLRCGRSESPSSTAYRQEYVHPYANPDLAFHNKTRESPRSPSHLQHIFTEPIAPSDSDRTVTEASTSGSWSMGSVITPDSSTASVTHKAKGSHSSGDAIQIKDISGPVATRRPSFQDSHSSLESVGRPFAPPIPVRGIPGWHDTPQSPGFTLISLEEAQAQARGRLRGATTQVVMSQHGYPGAAIAFPSAPSENSTVNSRVSSSKNSSGSPTSVTSRSRARSISAGARARSTFQSMSSRSAGKDNDAQVGSGDDHTISDTAPRTVKHKRSGFMRLFNKEKGQAIPPVPQLSSEAQGANGPQLAAPRNTKDLKRVPVPSLTPSLLAASDGMLGVSDADRRKNSPSPRRANLPALSIIPPGGASAAQEPFNPEDVRERGRSRTATPTVVLSAIERPLDGLSPSPRSAPPAQTDFKGLSLRPVSTAFSAHFSDHLLPDPNDNSPQGDFDLDLDTPTTMNTALTTPSTSNSSPFRSGFGSTDTLSGNRAVSVAVTDDDSSAVIQALQEQIVSARKGWQMQIWELEGQVRDLKSELEQLRAAGNVTGYCEVCGRGSAAPGERHGDGERSGVLDRPRAPTGVGSRFGCSN